MIFLERFFIKTKLKDHTNCIEWQAGCNADGYGVIYNPHIQRVQLAHRVAFELAEGAIPKGSLVCHNCDNPKCVNYQHMRLGTNADNTLDKVKRGRQSCLKGKSNGNSKLTEAKVVKIRSLYASDKFTQKELAEKFKVTQTAIGSIVTRKKWSHI